MIHFSPSLLVRRTMPPPLTKKQLKHNAKKANKRPAGSDRFSWFAYAKKECELGEVEFYLDSTMNDLLEEMLKFSLRTGQPFKAEFPNKSYVVQEKERYVLYVDENEEANEREKGIEVRRCAVNKYNVPLAQTKQNK